VKANAFQNRQVFRFQDLRTGTDGEEL